jgi:formylglycine-generating enzyme required for sulfatase activity
MMGSPKGEEARVNNETQHKVTLSKGFYMGVYTVTHEQWQAVMGNNPSWFKGDKNPNGDKNLPVEMVSWEDCQVFLEKLSKKEGHAYRLPTEAEWEYACRAGTTTPFYFGETISTDQANYNGSDPSYKSWFPIGFGASRQRTTPVGTFPPNAFGLYDMHGNVWQWCQDWVGADAQEDAVDPTGPESGKNRRWRGSSFFYPAYWCRSALRGGDGPSTRLNLLGFRVARTITP